MNKIITQSSELTYITELYRDGMVDTGFTKLSHLERLAQLRRRRKAWANLEWKSSSVVQLNDLCHAYELVGGLFAHWDSNVAEFVTTSLQSSTPPCRRNVPGITPRDFAIDPGQDIVVFMEPHGNPSSPEEPAVFKLHVRSISTQGPHAKARSPILPVVVPPNSRHITYVPGVTVQLADDIVALMLCTGRRQQLILYNWRDGNLIFDSAERGYDYPREIDFSFINSRAYLLTYPGTSEENGSIQIYSFESVQGFDPVHVASLLLPELDRDARFQSISPHTGPFETPLPNTPFTTSSTLRLYVLTLSILYDRTRLGIEPQLEVFHLFVKCSTFLSYLWAFHSGESPKGLSVPWSLWGRSGSRLLPSLSPSSSWMRYVHGQKVVFPQKRGSSDKTVVRILNFNVHPSLEEEQEPDPNLPVLCAAPTRIRHCFRHVVTTTLPYSTGTCTLFELSDEYSAYMIDEDHIVGIKAGGDFDEEIQELHVFTFCERPDTNLEAPSSSTSP
ncbi:hypothetical protein DXG01_012279 [Tephrocybe rancida]|nr:hypothetical protein DXG01_012279 [Tephrocybe rancida]